ncbi:hypothetical protein SARC_15182, partial [Sphaeroforma arctica JP610]
MQKSTHQERGAVIQSTTGTGKSLAFLLPALSHIDRTQLNTQILIVTPTRELSVQISKVILPLLKGGSAKYKTCPITLSRLTGIVDKDMKEFL